MYTPTTDVEKQIEQAFSYRGNVSISFKDGDPVEAYLFNREFVPHPSLKEEPFVEVFLLGGERQKYPIAQIASIALTGKDHAQV